MNNFKNLLKNITKNKFGILISIIVLIGIWLRCLVYSFNRSLWMDEAALANNLILPHSILNNMEYQQAAPPIFKLISLFNIHLLGNNEYALRLFPLICGILAIPLFWLIVKQIFNSKIAQTATITLFSINYLLIYYSSEFKQYSSDVLCALILIYTALKLNIYNTQRKNLILLSILYASVFWLSHTSLFVLAGIFLVNFYELISEFKQKNKSQIKNYTVNIITTYLPSAFSFILYWFLHLNTISNSNFMHNYWSDYFINNTANINFIMSNTIKMLFYPNICYLTIFGICILGVITLYKTNLRNAQILTLPVLILLCASYLEIYPLGYRLVLFTIPLILIYFCSILNTKNKYMLIVAIIIFIIGVPRYFTYYPLIISQKNMYLREELRTIYEYLEQRIEPNDIIFTANDVYQQDKYYRPKFKFKNNIIQTRKGSKTPFEKMEKGKRYRVIFNIYWIEEKRKRLPELVKWLSQNTRIISQYVYYENYVFYVEKL